MTEERLYQLLRQFRLHEADTGSSAVQIVKAQFDIDRLSHHLTKFPDDLASLRGLIGMVSERKANMKYLARRDPASYKRLVEALGLKLKV